MKNILIGVAGIVFGLLSIVFRKSVSKSIIEDQNRRFGFGYGDREIRRTSILSVVIGVFAIALGVFILFK